jgi:hypothetical protein
MTQINYATMSDAELKHYLVTHKDDQEAFYAYMDRRRLRSNRVSIKFDDPDWEEKILSAIQAQLNSK